MRELTPGELKIPTGGVTGSLTIGPGSLIIGKPLGNLPPLSIMFEGNQGTISFNGMTLPFGPGLPPIPLP